MKLQSNFIKLFYLSVCLSVGMVVHAGNERLWYQQPAEQWMEAMPIGNGRLSAMVYGGVDKEILALNEISMWSGQPDATSNDLCGKEALAEMREAFFTGDPIKANELGEKYLTGRMTTFGTHVPLGNLVIDFKHSDDNYIDYKRTLNLSNATAYVEYNSGKVNYHREYIASYPDDIIAMRYTASKRGALSATFSLDLLQKANVGNNEGDLTFEGKVEFPMHGPGGVNFWGNVRIIPEGGQLFSDGKSISVVNADAMTIFVDIRTNYNNAEYATTCNETIERASKSKYSVLRKRHHNDYQSLYERMSIRLGNDDKDDIPTDLRLKSISSGVSDSGFDALFFQYGRYMLISSSRKNSMPLCANLQGIWNDNGACNMAWTCDYHLDMNIQQNYWSANRTNLAECNEPLFDYLGLLALNGADAAKKIYGCRGWVAHTVCNAWGYTAPGWGVSWGMNVTGGAWLATHLWSHYRYTLDRNYLRNTAYPILRGAAQFFSDYMVEDLRNGYLVTGPSISPENGYIGPDGRNLSLAMMPTIDRTMVYDIYNACIESADILGIDDEFTQSLRRDIKRLPPLMVGSDGLVQEWLEDVKRSDPSHRHSSHLHSLFPLDQISYSRDPELIDACRRSLDTQTADPNWEDTEWSTANMLCFRARMKEGDVAYDWLQNLFKRFTRENLMTVSPAGIAMAEYDIFSFDATEGAVAGMCEMLLQCYDGFLDFLPALPAEWSSGEVAGLCAHGGLVIDMAWSNGTMDWARITSTVDDAVVNIKGYKNDVKIPRGKSLKIKF